MSNILKDYFEDLQEFAPRFVVMASGRKVPIYQLWLADGGSAARYVIYAFGIYALMLTAIGGFDLEAIKLPVLAMSFFAFATVAFWVATTVASARLFGLKPGGRFAFALSCYCSGTSYVLTGLLPLYFWGYQIVLDNVPHHEGERFDFNWLLYMFDYFYIALQLLVFVWFLWITYVAYYLIVRFYRPKHPILFVGVHFVIGTIMLIPMSVVARLTFGALGMTIDDFIWAFRTGVF
ncbi:hypothetical protein MWU53_15460 [Aliiroseovarius sp. S1123]|uniref:hypothetical protein n=1 Tax=unclassified Aliiroseovarius TaxID=2623558 RepID=UPI001FF47BD8|nr:hypothetical protein [Aliiroseovarius sp. S1123]MCK0172458.1 hypothetical protein [Aliiroseovarius sp. S1123]